MRLPEGFSATLFAGEPDVKQPIGFCLDDRGRVWVAEAYSYPQHGSDPAGDRIIILEDRDGDGRFDERTVFYDKLNYVTGIEVGFGGVWVMSPPNFYFIADANGDDIPDSEPQVLLDGFGNHANAHNLANGFAWGPDGWLYGTHGRTNWSRIGKPGTPDDQRVRFDGGVYRYHPIRHEWEPYADGTTNPWGIDWNDFGDAFVCNCVNPHLFQVIPGAHYEPWRNRQSSQHAYQRIDTIADHLHFVGIQNVRDGIGSSDEDTAGGGHAHCGTMVYLGDNWPADYRNSVFMNNIHGRRINNDLLERFGSGYTAHHGRDLMRSADPWFMGVTLRYGPDGGVFVSDWSDTGECHSVRNTRRHTGRIYKIVFDQPEQVRVDVGAADVEQLLRWQLHRNDWFVRHSRRVLQERMAAGQPMDSVRQSLREMLVTQTDIPRKLRCLWALYVLEDADDAFLTSLLDDHSPYLRAWAVRLLCEDRRVDSQVIDRFCDMASNDPSAYVRLYMTSALMRLDEAARWRVLPLLLQRAEDNSDQNLPLMEWYALQPLVNSAPDRFVQLLDTVKLSTVQRHIARRIASDPKFHAQLPIVIDWFQRSDDNRAISEVLSGLLAGFAGQKSVPMPNDWPAVFDRLSSEDRVADEGLAREIYQKSVRLALLFRDKAAEAKLRAAVENGDTEAAFREVALAALIESRTDGLGTLLIRMIDDPALQRTALRGLSSYTSPDIPRAVLSKYGSLPTTSRQDALQTLASRRAWATQLLDAVAAGEVPRSDLSTYTARQLRSLGDPDIARRVNRLWGEVRRTDAESRAVIQRRKQALTPDVLQQASVDRGRALFEKQCANCHTIFGRGGKIGPDLTGAQRTNLDYLLENMIAPSAAVSRDYQMETIVTDSGRVVTGLVVAQSPLSLTVQTINDRILIPVDEIDDRQKSRVSMMPAGLLDDWTDAQVADLIRFLSQ